MDVAHRAVHLARKEARHTTGALRTAAAQYRRDIARLKRDSAQREGQVMRLARRLNEGAAPRISDADPARMRCIAEGLHLHSFRLGILSADYGSLIGVTGQTLYKPEHGSTHPRKQQLSALAALRGEGKRGEGARVEIELIARR